MNRLEQILQREASPLLGLAVQRYDPTFVEIIARLGFPILWVEMEHAFLTFREAADLCRIAGGLGMLTMIRIPDARRENVLKAAECGPDIIDLPMANSPEIAAEFVAHARYAPEGGRGFFSNSPAMRYGLIGSIREEQHRINQQLTLMAQIETREAVDRAEDLCRVPGIDAFLLGLGDLSASMGIPGETKHPAVLEAADRTIAIAKKHGKRIAIPASPADVPFWAGKGADMLFCGGDVVCLKLGAQTILKEARGMG